MKKMSKRFSRVLGLVLVFAMMFSVGSVYAGESTIRDNGQNVHFETTAELPQNILNQIVNAHPEASQITILDVQKAVPSSQLVAPESRSFGATYTNVKTTTTASNALLTDAFVTSCAKGMTFTITNGWSYTVTTKLTGDLPFSQLGISGSVTGTYAATYVYTGPPETSINKSRQYRTKFFGNTGTYTAFKHNSPNPSAIQELSGNWLQPIYSVNYSYDIRG